MTRRSIYVLFLILLFAKSNVSAVPANSYYFHNDTATKISHHSSLFDADKTRLFLSNVSIIDDDNEEDDHAPEWKKETTCFNTLSTGNLYAKGFLIHQFKNSLSHPVFYSSYPLTYLRLRVIRI